MSRREALFLFGLSLILSLAVVVQPFYYSTADSSPQTGSLLITQVQITGGSGKTNQDFVKIYNPSEATVNLNGYRLIKRTKTGTTDTSLKSWTADTLIPSHGYHLWANSADGFAASLNADSSSTQTLAADNGVGLRWGKENDGLLIDSLAWGAAVNGLAEISPYPQNPAEGQTLLRQNNADSNNNASDFVLTGVVDNSTTTNTTTSTTDGTSKTDSEQVNNFVGASGADQTKSTVGAPTAGEVVINEFVADPTDGENEWIELYNTGNSVVDVSGWTIEDGGGVATLLSGILTLDGSGRFLVVNKPKGSLNNAGDMIILKDSSGAEIDQVVYGNWLAGQNNAPTASDPNSVARRLDGLLGGGLAEDFVVTKQPTKGASNIIVSPTILPTAPDNISQPNFDSSQKIFIDEILPNPAGDDNPTACQNCGEFIELYNSDDRAVDLLGWALESGDRVFQWQTTTILPAKNYLTIRRGQSHLILDNDKGSVALYQPWHKTAQQRVSYEGGGVGESYAVSLTSLQLAWPKWRWTDQTTAGASNLFPVVNQAPQAIWQLPVMATVGAPLIFDGSDSFDDDNDRLSFAWDFGDGSQSLLAAPDHTFLTGGDFEISLTVSDGVLTNILKRQLKVILPATETLATPTSTPVSIVPPIFISEIMPNPKGADTGQEWLELYNAGTRVADLDGWQIKAGRKFKLSKISLAPHSFYVAHGNLALTNAGGTVSLTDAADQTVDSVVYGKALDNQSYVLNPDNKIWSWSKLPTPSLPNIVAKPLAHIVIAKNKAAVAKSVVVYSGDTSDLAAVPANQSLSVTGAVIAVPSTLGSQVFYVAPEADASQSLLDWDKAVEIYSQKKTWPSLVLGEVVKISGVIAQPASGPRLRIKQASDVQIVGQMVLPTAATSTIADLGDEAIGHLIAVSGQITGKQGSTFYLDDGSGELAIYLKSTSGLTSGSLAVGDNVSVTGLLMAGTSAPRLLPRQAGDVVKLTDEKINAVKLSGADLAAPTVERRQAFWLYAGAASLVLAGGFVAYKRRK